MRSVGRRRSDFWRPLFLALATAGATNLAQAVWNYAATQELAAYYVTYVRGTMERCWWH